MFDRAHGYLRKRNAPAWVLIVILAIALGYEIIDALSNIEFLAEHSGAVETLGRWLTNPFVMALMFVAAFGWLLIAGPATGASTSTPVSVVAVAVVDQVDAASLPRPRVEISYFKPMGVYPWSVDHDGFVHVQVTNNGLADDFVGQIVDFWGIAEPQTPYHVKWRESEGEERRIYKDELINLAQITMPKDTTPRTTGTVAAMLSGAGLETPPMSDDGVDSQWVGGSVRLFSPNLTQGWTVHGHQHTTDFLGAKKPDPLSVFDVKVGLKLRITASSGESVEKWIIIEFERPEWHYRSQFWMQKGYKVEVADSIAPERLRL